MLQPEKPASSEYLEKLAKFLLIRVRHRENDLGECDAGVVCEYENVQKHWSFMIFWRLGTLSANASHTAKKFFRA